MERSKHEWAPGERPICRTESAAELTLKAHTHPIRRQVVCPHIVLVAVMFFESSPSSCCILLALLSLSPVPMQQAVEESLFCCSDRAHDLMDRHTYPLDRPIGKLPFIIQMVSLHTFTQDSCTQENTEQCSRSHPVLAQVHASAGIPPAA